MSHGLGSNWNWEGVIEVCSVDAASKVCVVSSEQQHAQYDWP